MVRLKLTRRWKKRGLSRSSDSMWKGTHLHCNNVLVCGTRTSPLFLKSNYWVGSVRLGLILRKGKIRRSVKAAQQDAERIAVELLRDIRDGMKEVLEQHGMGEDD